MSDNYFSKFSEKELEGRNESTKREDEKRKEICERILNEYNKGIRKSKKKK